MFGLFFPVLWSGKFYQEKAKVTVGFTSYVYLLSKIIAFCCPLFIVWEEVLHVFCPVLYFLIVGEKVQNKYLDMILSYYF